MKLGVDIAEIADFKKRCAKNEFVEWIFTKREIEYCSRKMHPWQCYAGKFAAKEAMLKASYNNTCKGLTVIKYEILNDPNGKPYVAGYENALLNISYGNDIVIAVVIIP